MLRRFSLKCVALLAVGVMALPMVAAARPSRDSNSRLSTTITINSPVTFAGTPLKPGTYEVVATESTVIVSQDGRKLVESAAEIRDDQHAPHSSNIVLDGNQVKEVHFGGKTKYISLSS